MANITSRVWFQKGLIAIPSYNEIATQTLIDNAIATHEPMFLSELFGYEFSKGLLAHINADPIAPNPLYDNLIDGVEYVDSNGQLQTTKKLAEACSLYIFFQLLTETNTTWSGNGEYLAQTENGLIVSPAERMANVWNRMVEQNHKIYQFIDTKQTDYALVIFYGGSENLLSNINKYGI